MRVTIDDSGYITGWNVVDDDEGLPCEIPEDFEKFSVFYNAYRYDSGFAYLDEFRLIEIENDRRKQEIRVQREVECFPFINRGPLWYAKLDEQKISELNSWYNEWLDAPDTGSIPIAPEWLK